MDQEKAHTSRCTVDTDSRYAFLILWLVILAALQPAAWSQTTAASHDSTESVTLADSQLHQKRASYVALLSHIQNLEVSRYKVPPLNFSATGDPRVTISLQVSVVSVLDVDDTKQSVSSILNILATWNDPELAWNASDYSGVESVEISVDSIWAPDIFITNSLDATNIMSIAKHLQVNYDGTISALTLVLKESTCALDLSIYPYDTQHCSIILQPASISTSLKLVGYEIVDNTFQEKMAVDNNWHLIGVDATDNYGKPEQRSAVIIDVTVRRKSLYYTVCLVIPMVLTSYMNTLVFLVPLESGEKVSFLVSIFVSTSVFVSFFKDMMPRGLEIVPTMMKLLIGVIVESFLILLATLFVMYYHNWSQREGKTRKSATEANSTKKNEADTQISSYHCSIVNPEDKSYSVLSPIKNFTNFMKVAPLPEISKNNVGEDALPSQHTGKERNTCQSSLLTTQRLESCFFVISFVLNTVYMLFCFSAAW